MDTKAYIESGIIELYVAGQLTEKENLEVARYARMYPEIKKEILEVENTILAVSRSASPKSVPSFDAIRQKLEGQEGKVIPMEKKSSSWKPYVGWAAAVVCALGIVYLYNQNEQLNSGMEVTNTEIEKLEQEIKEANESLEKSTQLLDQLRNKDVVVVQLGGQSVSPESFAKAYWNKEEGQLFIDAQGLPEPPEGMAYQVWSLTLDPLTPTSVGLLENFESNDNGVFTLVNSNASEAFGITLEPEGGSAAPNLEQLYVLGTVSS
ncbi:anti-sigma factor [Flagellimonas allohymeniacidonis]|uniref:Anti-sigma factor n=1 Tax=Flagellimonas allohymeniacidonis TaxID=2517819 RepID=A0A4Q8QGZ4_9FLAO|nr:anti-sigma factor [Allomuricauda hymeniacidonis]TAI48518.1 anti-sigma factor [Allomuricauda hymeniacidonis]